MIRVFFIASIWLLSCGQKSGPEKVEVRDIVLNEISEEPDTSSRSEGAFQWKEWVKPDPQWVYLSDKILKHLAKGHVSIDGSYGDIDNNGILDLIVITALGNEDSLLSTGKQLPRHLLVFLDQNDLSFRNNNAIPCNICCVNTDSYAGHIANTGQFIIMEDCRTDKKRRREYRFNYISKINDWLLDSVITETSDFIKGNYTLDTMTKKDFGKLALKTFSMQSLRTKLK